MLSKGATPLRTGQSGLLPQCGIRQSGAEKYPPLHSDVRYTGEQGANRVSHGLPSDAVNVVIASGVCCLDNLQDECRRLEGR